MQQSIIKSMRYSLAVLLVLGLAGCLHEEDDQGSNGGGQQGQAQLLQAAAVATAASDFSSGANSLIDMDNGLLALNGLAATAVSDLGMAARGNAYYRLERFTGANLSRFDLNDNRDTPVWQYSLRDAGDSAAQTNPQNMVFASDSKAYVFRYEKNTAWIVNPEAASEAGFKIGELDLGSYADSDGIAEMHNGVVADGKLFITLQRIDRDNGFRPTNTACVAVFDVSTDQEIDTGYGDPDCGLGIPLTIRNPNADIVYLPAMNAVFIQGAGDYGNIFITPPVDITLSGGVERIDVTSYATQVVVRDSLAGAVHGQTVAMLVVSDQEGWLVGYQGFFNNSLFRFNPTSGEVGAADPAALAGIQISDLALDPLGRVWISDSANASIHVLEAGGAAISQTISTLLNPGAVVFVGY